MADKDLQEKLTYFQQQDLLELSDDEEGFPDSGLLAGERLLADTKAMRPPSIRRGSVFLGPTPRERQQEFEALATRQRTEVRERDSSFLPSSTAPELVIKSFPITNAERGQVPRKTLKTTASMSDITAQDRTPFYIRVGQVPRELKNKNAKPATDIKIEPERRQLLREKVVYFFPNDDVSMVRRRRIHKVIQLGATWVTTWRDDVTHVFFDEEARTYPQLLGHLSMAGLPRKVTVVKFEPYIPQCIQSGMLLDPTAGRFLVKGAPRPVVARPMSLSDSLNPSNSFHANSTEDGLAEHMINKPSSPNRGVGKDSLTRALGSPTMEATELADAYNDELSKAIQETKSVAHLPLDDDEDSESRPTSSTEQDSGPDTDDKESHSKPKHTKGSTASPTKKGGINQSQFQCMNPTGGSSLISSPNARTIEILDQMGKYYNQMQDQWRTLAYRKAIATLRKQTVKISTAKEAIALPFIGSRLADKIEEIVLTDRLRRLDSTCDDPTDKLLRLFTGVYGAGLVQANKWIQAGYRSLDELVAKAKLTESQKIGIKYYDHFAARIPRAEVKAHGDYVRKALQKIDPEFEATITGSYRRGAKDSGDIDIIITKPGATVSTLRDVVFHTLVPLLTKEGFLKAKLATSSTNDDGTKWHGVSCLPTSTTWRRLDLLLVREEEIGAAFLYFTGNDIFNRSMRLLASKKYMRLNQRGLYKDVIRKKNREKLNEGTLVEGKDEKRIFEILEVPWREPHERIC